ncbi:cytoplasmic protein [Pseudochrobactrum sp. HB0163]|uniref:cytoplasmic protein n=1 Tax=Pseudochrobactrum sp. HB0163 TaxID=3450708 RepID=UPI003F6E21E3
MSQALCAETQLFLKNKEENRINASQAAALQLSCGIDLAQALNASTEQKQYIIARLNRLLRRERLKGVNRHWGYDINRHIALKQLRDRLISITAAETAAIQP